MADTDAKLKNNIKALGAFRLKGEVIKKHRVISKKDFARKSDWQNLCNMNPKPRAEETSDKVADAPAEDKASTKASAKVSGGLPGAGAS